MSDRSTSLVAVTLLAALVAACGGGDGGSPSPAPAPAPAPAPVPTPAPAPVPAPPSVVNANLLPQVIDPAVTTALETHVAINPSPDVAAKNRLFVFLPGTGAHPASYQKILVSGAARGLHTLGLNYPNPVEVGVLCAGTAPSEACFWNVRREILTGADLTTKVSIAPPDAIVTRVAEALAYLQANFPDQGWGQYLQGDGSVDWRKVTVGGHSQGGGHAGVMAKLYAMHGACYFDSPADWDLVPGQPAGWEAYPNVTPAASQFGFSNTLDTLVPWVQLQPIWQSMGLAAFGAPMSVDGAAAPYGGSHMLTTTTSAAGSTGLHSLTVADLVTPMAGGQPLFDAVWNQACFQ